MLASPIRCMCLGVESQELIFVRGADGPRGGPIGGPIGGPRVTPRGGPIGGPRGLGPRVHI